MPILRTYARTVSLVDDDLHLHDNESDQIPTADVALCQNIGSATGSIGKSYPCLSLSLFARFHDDGATTDRLVIYPVDEEDSSALLSSTE